MTRRYPFTWLDVFATTPLEGNQLAVFPDARGLSDEQMHAIARETRLSETTFVFPRSEKVDLEQGFKTRIFAVSGEMPFAGHPTLGTAMVLSETRGLMEVILEENVGKIPVTFTDREGRRFGEMVQKDPSMGSTHDLKAVAKALGVQPCDLDNKHPIQTVSTGIPFAIVPFRTLESLRKAHPNWAAMEDYLARTDAKFFYLVSRECVDAHASLHARMVFSGGEDPATGSAAGPAIAWMVMHGLARPGHSIMVEQGLETLRPSHLYTRASLKDGKPTDVRVGGYCVYVIEGTLIL